MTGNKHISTDINAKNFNTNNSNKVCLTERAIKDSKEKCIKGKGFLDMEYSDKDFADKAGKTRVTTKVKDNENSIKSSLLDNAFSYNTQKIVLNNYTIINNNINNSGVQDTSYIKSNISMNNANNTSNYSQKSISKKGSFINVVQ